MNGGDDGTRTRGLCRDSSGRGFLAETSRTQKGHGAFASDFDLLGIVRSLPDKPSVALNPGNLSERGCRPYLRKWRNAAFTHSFFPRWLSHSSQWQFTGFAVSADHERLVVNINC